MEAPMANFSSDTKLYVRPSPAGELSIAVREHDDERGKYVFGVVFKFEFADTGKCSFVAFRDYDLRGMIDVLLEVEKRVASERGDHEVTRRVERRGGRAA
jgi:hypothetical protein